MSHNLVALRSERAPEGPALLDRLRAVMDEHRVITCDDVRRIAREMAMPESAVFGVATYYGDFSMVPRGRRRVHTCVGTACFAVDGNRHVAHLESALGVKLGETRSDGEVSLEPVYCLGLCGRGPAVMVDEPGHGGGNKRVYARVDSARAQQIGSGEALDSLDGSPTIASRSAPTVVLRNMVDGRRAATLSEALGLGVYDALLGAAREAAGARVLDEVTRSELRGRGGAGFATAQKWRFAAEQPPGEKFVVCNADEGDPGSYIDKWLLELDPHSVIEGMALAGLAIGAAKGVLYIRSEYPAAVAVTREAVREARAAGLLARSLGPSGFTFDVEVFEGAGSYVCGEETALMRSIEGLRGVVTARPPFPAVKGLFERPTSVNNVETLINIPWIVAHGGESYRAVGVGKSRGTKCVSLNERFARPGLYEVPLGTSLRTICEDYGGGLVGAAAIKALQLGGPLGGIIPASLIDTPLGFEELTAVGGLLGHGGLVAFDQRTDMRLLALHLFEFGATESCGKCFPCRIGMHKGLELLRGLCNGTSTLGDPAGLLTELCETLRYGSLCAHGAELPAPIMSILKHFRGELLGPPKAHAHIGGAE